MFVFRLFRAVLIYANKNSSSSKVNCCIVVLLFVNNDFLTRNCFAQVKNPLKQISLLWDIEFLRNSFKPYMWYCWIFIIIIYLCVILISRFLLLRVSM